MIRDDNGHWGTPIPLPGLAAMNKGGSALVGALSCPSRRYCAVGGDYAGRLGRHRGFVTQGR